MRELPEPTLDLDEPGTIQFTAERALLGRTMNRFALSLRLEENRAKFLDDPRGYADGYGVGSDQMDLLEARDWTALLRAGVHLHALLKVAATLGYDLWDIGADNAGVERTDLIDACPRWVKAVPGEA